MKALKASKVSLLLFRYRKSQAEVGEGGLGLVGGGVWDGGWGMGMGVGRKGRKWGGGGQGDVNLCRAG
jgi:hypothetical protein